jgi:uncharacterized protein
LNIIIAGGTGFVGQNLAPFLKSKGHEVTILSRTKAKVTKIFKKEFKALEWSDLKPANLKNQDLVINLCGLSIGEHRWSKQIKRELIASRAIPTETLASLCGHLKDESPRLFNASAVGVYGPQITAISENKAPEPFTEQDPLPRQARNFLSEIGLKWENALISAIENNVSVTVLRFAVVLSDKGGALPQMARPVKWGLGHTIGSGAQLFSWVHINDLISAIDFLINNPDITGPVNIVSPQTINQRNFALALGHALKRPIWLYLPSWLLIILFGEMAQELLLSGQGVSPQKLVKAGFKFQYPRIKEALEEIYKKK